MDSSLTELCGFFADASRRREPLVLATIVRTEGSTYRKAGARILISHSGATSGLLSGGCLEADLRERAARVLARGRPEGAIFDSRTSDDPIWGAGLGCEGANHIWLQAATEEGNYAPLPYLSQCLSDQDTGSVVTVIGGEALPTELGRHGYAGVLDRDPLGAKLSTCRSVKPEIQNLRYLDRTLEVFVAPVILPPTLLLCGAGPDAVPVAHGGHGVLRCDVALLDDHTRAELTVELLEACGVDVGGDDGEPVGDEPLCDRPADARGGTRHQRQSLHQPDPNG